MEINLMEINLRFKLQVNQEDQEDHNQLINADFVTKQVIGIAFII